MFWASIRENTLKANSYAREIEAELVKLKKIYPALRPANFYFTIGALRTGGTAMDGMVLIGSEIALADKSVATEEFPKGLEHLKPFFEANSIDDLVFTNVHEYVHTQQKMTLGDNLLAQSVLEGVAEFVAVQATGKPSPLPAIVFGRENAEQVRERFATEIFNLFPGFWLYSNAENEFEVRDLGYYVGYAICERYYQKAPDKGQAISEMIELDYNKETELIRFVDESGYFSRPVAELKRRFEESRPVVTRISQLKNQQRKVSPKLTTITVEFSAPMDTRYRNFELGPLGETNLMRVKQFRGFSEDGKSATIEVELKPNRRYQLVIGNGFRSKEGISLKPYLIDFTTSNK